MVWNSYDDDLTDENGNERVDDFVDKFRCVDGRDPAVRLPSEFELEHATRAERMPNDLKRARNQ